MVLFLRWRLLVVLALLTAAGALLWWYQSRRGEVAAVSWAVAGRTIAVDPGHGGVDPGAVGPGGTLEKDVTLAISLRLRRILEQAGAVVVMTRETDTDLSTPGKSLGARKREDLDRRLALVREKGADVYLGIQANAFGTRWTGAQTFYYPRGEESRRLAEEVQAELRRILGNTQRRAKALDIYVLRNLNIPAVIVEVGFLSNAEEERLLNDPGYQEKVALAIFSGLVRYLAGG